MAGAAEMDWRPLASPIIGFAALVFDINVIATRSVPRAFKAHVKTSLSNNLGFVNVLGSIVGVELGLAKVRHFVPGARR